MADLRKVPEGREGVTREERAASDIGREEDFESESDDSSDDAAV